MRLPGSAQDPLWYKDAIIYEAHVRTFFDSTGDGVGDFAGLTQKLDYLQDLGITALWLLPFYPSPLRDDGYDIANYTDVHPSYGTLADFRTFLEAAHRRGIQVITELVVNHTSDQHAWFQAARHAPAGSAARDFYVWSETKQRYRDARIIFTDTEHSNWTWDDQAGAYLWHRFFHHQPDLNYDNPRVLEAMLEVMRFWLAMGVDGLRFDAVPYLIEREGTNCENLPETHAILKKIRRAVDAGFENRMLLAEANQWPADVRAYFGDGDECHMGFHFPLMPRIFMAVRQEDRHPITEILHQTPDIPDNCHWALFLRNHDELTLEMVSDEERDYMYRQYAADPQMRINIGIRRRLAPLCDNSRRRIELLNSLLFSLPGTPVIYYGDEIGMGDNIYLGDRNGVRTPMQWTGDRNAGFSRADPARLYAPLIMDPVYGYQAINVEAQERAPFSLLHWMKRMISLRKQHQTLGRGTIEFLAPQNRKVLAYVRRLGDEAILIVANLARSVQPVELDLHVYRGLTPIEMLGRTEFPSVGDQPYFLTLGPHSFYWFQLVRTPAPVVTARVPAPSSAAEQLPALLVGPTWETLLDGAARSLIEREVLGPFLVRQRWYGGKARTMANARLIEWAVIQKGQTPAFLALAEVAFNDGGVDTYVLPLATATGEAADTLIANRPHAVAARITGARKGILYDAAALPPFGEIAFGAIADSREFRGARGTIRPLRTAAFAEARGTTDPALPIRTMDTEQSNTSIEFGGRLILKLFRRIEPGPNPELEIGDYLTRSGFPGVPPLAGALEYVRDGRSTTLAVLHRLVANQGTGWSRAVDELGHYYDRAAAAQGRMPPLDPERRPPVALAGAPPPPFAVDAIGGYLASAAALGRRTAELHLRLAAASGDPALEPEPVAAADLAAAADEMTEQAGVALDALVTQADRLPDALRADAERLLGARDRVTAAFAELRAVRSAALRTRIHGDFHLGQVLVAEQDFVILDFEGEPARPLKQRRAKQSPLRDVAGMLRSFSYAAYAALFRHAADRPELVPRLDPWARAWQDWTGAVFLRSYLAAAADAAFLPAGDDLHRMLQAFMLDKALYELRYELNNRSDWTRIPLGGTLALIGVAPSR
jgi:maltose alpha-D-glucosyltransferase/alpha-amylase